MDFGFLGYMGLLTIYLFCCPPTLTAIAIGSALALNKRKAINLSNQQIWLFGIIFYVVAIVLTCVFIQVAGNKIYAM